MMGERETGPGHGLKIGIVGDALAPNFNEAYANQVRLLSRELGAPVLTCNDLGPLPLKRMGRYLIVNARFLRGGGHNRLLSLANGALFYPFVKLFERRCDVVFLSAGIDSGFLPILDARKCVPIINTLPFGDGDGPAAAFAHRFGPHMPAIVAQGQRIRARLIDMALDAERIFVAYPWVDPERFCYSEPPQGDEFRILFASAPNSEGEGDDMFVDKGLPLLLEAFARFQRQCPASLCLLWRGKYTEALYRTIDELGLWGRVEVIDRVADTPPLYARAHVTVTPFLNLKDSPEIPLSAVESLACGRPVVTTDIAELAGLVAEYRCGCVAPPHPEGFLSALVECRRGYPLYQGNCRRAAEELFSVSVGPVTQALASLRQKGGRGS